MIGPLAVVTWNEALTPPIFSVVDVEVFGALAEVTRTHTVWLLLMVVAALVKVPVQPTL
jgi:hypothetical protein